MPSRHEKWTNNFRSSLGKGWRPDFANKYDLTVTDHGCSALGWTLHPSIARNLGDSPNIADFATGTGEFLHLLAESCPRSRLDGFDISPAMFVSKGNVRFFIADVRDPPPTELHGVYHVVHLRYLVAGMEPDDWEPVLRNMLQLIKPGGAIQWVEPAFSQVPSMYEASRTQGRQ